MVQDPREQKGPSRIKLLQLKLAIVLLYVVFIVLVAFGEVFANNNSYFGGFDVLHSRSRINYVLYGSDPALKRLGFHG